MGGGRVQLTLLGTGGGQGLLEGVDCLVPGDVWKDGSMNIRGTSGPGGGSVSLRAEDVLFPR